ncbi:hypothetical protein CYLTODRAFT_417250 [Cylindrobasidium torrendii FP15055 ss-10]|uniref:Uncharacterized protein n=1 Tax=Cylindrobasidium torrendii FP15055 ss-10 TaxID=1314674 RepID=A0A0D7BSZ8_9AGAR|nr:hypothetical protein CYLTODRAFT_417250 [Cylindrobasidium torrendii FP15055 ss-10]
MAKTASQPRKATAATKPYARPSRKTPNSSALPAGTPSSSESAGRPTTRSQTTTTSKSKAVPPKAKAKTAGKVGSKSKLPFKKVTEKIDLSTRDYSFGWPLNVDTLIKEGLEIYPHTASARKQATQDYQLSVAAWMVDIQLVGKLAPLGILGQLHLVEATPSEEDPDDTAWFLAIGSTHEDHEWDPPTSKKVIREAQKVLGYDDEPFWAMLVW